MANIIFSKKSLTSSIEGDIKVNSKATADTYSLTTIDHSKLKNRDQEDQHPIEAISGLREAIDQLTEIINNLNTRLDNITEDIADNINALQQADQEIIARVEVLEEKINSQE